MTKRPVLTILAYTAIAGFIVLMTIILVAYGKGYTYDFKGGRFILKGQAALASTPSGAAVNLNGKSIHHVTPRRLILEAGRSYVFSLTKDGYYPWTKSLYIKASQVTSASYIWLFPKKITHQTVTPKHNVLKVAPSPDHRRFAYFARTPDLSLWVFDSSSRALAPLYTAKPADATAPAENLVDVAWAPDNSSLLLKTQTGSTTNFILVSPSGGTKTNLTEMFKFNFDQLQFNPSNPKQLYWISPDGLRLIDTTNQTVSAVQVSQLNALTFGANRLFYVQNTSLGKSLWSLDAGGFKQEIIPALPASNNYQLSYANFAGKDWLAVIPAGTSELTLYGDVLSAHPFSKIISKQADSASFSPSGQLLAYYSGNKLGSYDLDKDVIYGFPKLTETFSGLNWLDDYHLVANFSGTAKAMEYDGANLTSLGSVPADAPVYSTADKKYLLTTVTLPAGAGLGLQLLNLRL